MNQELVAGIEGFLPPGTFCPVAHEIVSYATLAFNVNAFDVANQVFLFFEWDPAILPQTVVASVAWETDLVE